MRVTYKDIFAAHHIDSGVLRWTNMNIDCSLNHNLLVALNKRFPRAITGFNNPHLASETLEVVD